jgi:hypothetical protein
MPSGPAPERLYRAKGLLVVVAQRPIERMDRLPVGDRVAAQRQRPAGEGLGRVRDSLGSEQHVDGKADGVEAKEQTVTIWRGRRFHSRGSVQPKLRRQVLRLHHRFRARASAGVERVGKSNRSLLIDDFARQKRQRQTAPGNSRRRFPLKARKRRHQGLRRQFIGAKQLRAIENAFRWRGLPFGVA